MARKEPVYVKNPQIPCSMMAIPIFDGALQKGMHFLDRLGR
jgi:hypothetical protein